MRYRALLALACLAAGVSLAGLTPAAAQDQRKQSVARLDRAVATALRKLDAQEPLTSADHTALKTAARLRKVDAIRVCGDPGNMPLSNLQREGFQNKIIELVAEAMGTRVSYFWRPYLERGITRQTFDADECEILLDMPTSYGGLLTTAPVYRTTYVLAWRSDRGLDISSLDDPKLKELRVGVYQTSGLRAALVRRGITNLSLHTISHDGDLRPEHQPWRQVQQVVDGTLDVAGVWGPFAGWLEAKGAPITVRPVNLMEDELPMEFDLSIGLRRTDQILKYKFELALDEKKAEIEAILRAFGVPLVQCSRCFVAGDLPAHGVYARPLEATAHPPDPTKLAEHQRVTRERLEAWLAEGADLNQELSNAVHATDADRVRFLVEKGADLNSRDLQGYAPLHVAARHRKTDMLGLLLDLGADVNVRDQDGFTPLLHAVLRDHPASVALLAARGADLDAGTKEGSTPLAMAIAEDKYLAAMALIEAGAPVNTRSGVQGLTPLMLAAGREPVQMTLGAGRQTVDKFNPQDPGTLEIARALLRRGADVNAVSSNGVTALMLAAAHNRGPVVGLLLQSGANAGIKSPDGRTALEIARTNGNDTVISIFKLLEQSGSN